MIEKAKTLGLPIPEETVILVVDDVVSNVQVVGSILGAAGYQVLPATSGEQALRYAANPAPDLILLDVMMPDMDGFEVCRRLKTAPETSAIPVIFLTAAVDSDLVVKGLELGAVDYVAKPFNSIELLARVRTHLELKFSREILERTADELRNLNKEKNDFLGIAAHDLKSPICNFIGLAEIMLSDPHLPVEERRDISQSILKESRRLLQLVDNLLSIDALERGQIQLQSKPFELAQTVQTVLETFRVRAEAKQQRLLYTAFPGTTVYGDPQVTTQILDNLVSNALKFSPPGTVIQVSTTPSNEFVKCEVQDQGPGLTLQDQKELFGKFARLSARPTADEGSTGLGLSIVKKLVQAMNGAVWCESQPGHGAKFVIRLPRARTALRTV
jgi:two-component system sensor histidine kinase/response regulator